MNKKETIEATPMVQRMCTNLLTIIGDKSSATGIQARVILGDTIADAADLISNDEIWAQLDSCFDIVRQTNCTLPNMEMIRQLITTETPRTLGATLLKDASIQLALAQQGKIISAMTFTSREDVDALILTIQDPFNASEEIAADTMDQMIYFNLVSLHAAVVNHLVQTARPLPEMMAYQFADIYPTLIISQRLYGDAGRYDEIRQENKIIHPAFCPANGRALSA